MLRGLFARARTAGDLAGLVSRAAALDPERAPLDYARAAKELAQVHARDGPRTEALRWFGRSIDAYIYAGLPGAAAAMCQKLIDYEPRVVRARATLALLLIGAGRDEEAAEQIHEFVDAAREQGGCTELTRERLLRIGRLAESRKIQELVEQALRELGGSDEADELRRMRREGRPAATAGPLPGQERWAYLIESAVRASHPLPVLPPSPKPSQPGASASVG